MPTDRNTLQIKGYQPQEHQQQIHALIEENRYSWIMGGFRSGKSRACFEQDIEYCMRYPKNVVLITRKFNEDLEKSSKMEFYEYCPRELIAHTREGRDICIFRNGSQVIFKGLYSKYGGQRSKLGSMNLGIVHVEEGSEIDLKDFLDLQGRLSLMTIPDGAHKIYITANPPTKDHWAFKLFEENPAEGYGLIKVSTRMNNRYLPPQYIKALEDEYAAQPGWLERFFDGQWGFVPQGDPVYGEFSSKTHVDNTIRYNPGLPLYRSWDFGWHHPAVVWLQINSDQQIAVLKEHMGNKIFLRDFAPRIVQMTNQTFPGADIIDTCDDAGKQQKDDGLPSIAILEGSPFKLKMQFRQSRVMEGIELVQQKLRGMVRGQPSFLISARECPILVEGFTGGYCRQGDNIMKDGYYDHLHDALREAFINIFGTRTKNVFEKFKIPGPVYDFSPMQTGKN